MFEVGVKYGCYHQLQEIFGTYMAYLSIMDLAYFGLKPDHIENSSARCPETQRKAHLRNLQNSNEEAHCTIL